MKFEGAGRVILNGPRASACNRGSSSPVKFRCLRSGAPTALAELSSGPPPGPFQSSTHAIRDEAFDGLGHIGEPGAAANLAIGEDVDADVALALQRVADGAVFDLV